MVVPGVGPVHVGHASTAVGLIRGLASQVGRTHPGDPRIAAIATAAHDDPARHGADLVLATHARRLYDERLRTGRLPSHAWLEHETPVRFERHLRRVHEEMGPELARRYGYLPLGERQIIGLAAANGAHGDVVRGLDALRAHPHYPARSSWRVLTHRFAPHEIARIAAEIVPGGSVEPVVEVYRALRREHAERYRLRRRALLRGLREMWVAGAPALVPLFHMLARGMSPEQIERFRAEIERDGDVESVLDQTEAANLEARLASQEAALRRFLAEYEHNRDLAATTPMDEAHVRPAGDGRADRARAHRVPPSARAFALGQALDLQSSPEDEEPVEAEADEDNADAGARRGGGQGCVFRGIVSADFAAS